MANGALGSGGTGDNRVDRIEEGLPGVATVKTTDSPWPNNPSANPPTRATFDAGLSAGGERSRAVAQVDTSGHLVTPWDALTQALPSAWGMAEEGQTLSVVHTAAANTVVGVVSFEQAASGAQYNISAGNTGSVFSINSNGTKATAVLTSDNTVPADGDTVTINDVTYRFESTLAQVNDVKVQGTADATLVSLAKAVNGSGVAGTDYFAGTTKPTGVTANQTVTSHAITLSASTAGTAGNAFASTETSAHLSFAGTTFSGGVNAGSIQRSASGSITAGQQYVLTVNVEDPKGFEDSKAVTVNVT